MRKIILAMAAVVIASGTANIHANEKTPISMAVDGKTAVIPMGGLVVGERKGRSAIFSPNGRYEIKGFIFDRWTGKEIRTTKEAEASINYLDFEKLQLDMTELGAIRIGSGPERVQVFMDPLCVPCRNLLLEVPPLTDSYTFEFLLVPSGNNQGSIQMIQDLHCASDRKAAGTALMTGSSAKALEQDRQCDKEPLVKRFMAAQLLPVISMPFIVAPSGLVSTTKPESLEQWLNHAR